MSLIGDPPLTAGDPRPKPEKTRQLSIHNAIFNVVNHQIELLQEKRRPPGGELPEDLVTDDIIEPVYLSLLVNAPLEDGEKNFRLDVLTTYLDLNDKLTDGQIAQFQDPAQDGGPLKSYLKYLIHRATQWRADSQQNRFTEEDLVILDDYLSPDWRKLAMETPGLSGTLAAWRQQMTQDIQAAGYAEGARAGATPIPIPSEEAHLLTSLPETDGRLRIVEGNTYQSGRIVAKNEATVDPSWRQIGHSVSFTNNGTDISQMFFIDEEDSARFNFLRIDNLFETRDASNNPVNDAYVFHLSDQVIFQLNDPNTGHTNVCSTITSPNARIPVFEGQHLRYQFGNIETARAGQVVVLESLRFVAHIELIRTDFKDYTGTDGEIKREGAFDLLEYKITVWSKDPNIKADLRGERGTKI